MWGQGTAFGDAVGGARIIPTRVGTSGEGNAKMIDWEDHPHACGDKYAPPYLFAMISGSSPRVWGQESCCFVCVCGIRIIPTRVGTRYAEKT